VSTGPSPLATRPPMLPDTALEEGRVVPGVSFVDPVTDEAVDLW
jgi:hypothetical protein